MARWEANPCATPESPGESDLSCKKRNYLTRVNDQWSHPFAGGGGAAMPGRVFVSGVAGVVSAGLIGLQGPFFREHPFRRKNGSGF